jgi:hypothetical protein
MASSREKRTSYVPDLKADQNFGEAQQRPKVGESGSQFAERLMNEKYGEGNWTRGTNTEFSNIQKWGDRSFQ